jgi:hypothetical protein
MRILSGFLLIAILVLQFSCEKLQQNELERNRRLWRESGITNYRMTVNLQKTGHATPNGKFVITVRQGIKESIKRADNPEADLTGIYFGRYVTIEEIFEYIERAQKEKWEWVKKEIEYDAKLGYPKKVSLDAARVFDEEFSLQVLQFDVLE